MHRRPVNTHPLTGAGLPQHTATMDIKGFKFEPVAWAGSALSLLVAVEAVNEGAHLLPDTWTPWMLGAIAVLGALLTPAVRNRVTPTAAPRDDAGVRLVRAPLAPRP